MQALGLIYAAAWRLILLIGSFKKLESKYNLQVIKKVMETSKPKSFNKKLKECRDD